MSMNIRNPKLVKFMRKEIQQSDQIQLQKKDKKDKEYFALKQKQKPLSKDQQKLRENIKFYHNEKGNCQQQSRCNELQSQQMIKNEQSIEQRDAESSKQFNGFIVFDCKLTKVVMPQALERVRIVSKIQNKLVSCLDRKKPQIPMKKLVKLDMLSEIIDRKQRKLVTINPRFIQKLDGQAKSLKKPGSSNQKQNQKPALKQLYKNKPNKEEYVKANPINILKPNESQQGQPFLFEQQNVSFLSEIIEHSHFLQEHQPQFQFIQDQNSNFSIFQNQPNPKQQNSINSIRQQTNYYQNTAQIQQSKVYYNYDPFHKDQPQHHKKPNNYSKKQQCQPKLYQNMQYINPRQIRIPRESGLQQPRHHLSVVQQEQSFFYNPQQNKQGNYYNDDYYNVRIGRNNQNYTSQVSNSQHYY